ncbi:Os07g0644500 [Oryza sativa Japonica Group]|uniref:Os07g0644500 protein n=1 Tax=Oryza sativa subsp. japonica TaxID=39947 RepID=A0A0N7KNY2_ORYSJ|nr:Os07g0644500 [Oryza sativa Japonica Group]
MDGDPPGGEDGESAVQRGWRPPGRPLAPAGSPGRPAPAAREAIPRPARPANPRRAQDRQLMATAAHAGSSQAGTDSNPLDGAEAFGYHPDFEWTK